MKHSSRAGVIGLAVALAFLVMLVFLGVVFCLGFMGRKIISIPGMISVRPDDSSAQPGIMMQMVPVGLLAALLGCALILSAILLLATRHARDHE